MSERMSEDMSERMWEDMSERMSKDMSERMSGDMSERMAKDMSERMSKDMSERMSEDIPERMSQDMSQRMSGDMPEDIAERMSKDMSERMWEDMSERMSEDMSERYVRQYVPSICAYIDLDNMNSCLHQRNLVDGILFFVSFGTLQKVLLAQLCFCARKWVWFGSHGGGCGGTSWDDLHWDCQSGCERSWACVAL